MTLNALTRAQIFALFLLIIGVFNALFHLHEVNQARDTFMHRNPCPSTGKAQGSCPGWVISYETPLCSGGAEDADNMQWETAAEADVKSRQQRLTFEHGAIQGMTKGRGSASGPEGASKACEFRMFSS